MKNQVMKYFVLVLLFTASIQSCKKDDLDEDLVEPVLSDVPEGYFEYEKKSSGFTDRIVYHNKAVLWENENTASDSLTSNSADTRTEDDYSDVFWLHVADIQPYFASGEQLSATHIDFFDNKAFVSYHKQGNTHLGAIEIIDLTIPDKPKVVFKFDLTKSDINALTVGRDENGQDLDVWLALSDKDKGAVLAELKMKNGEDLDKFSIVNLSKFIESGITSSANAVTQSGDYLYISSGKTYGGVFCLDANDLSVLGSVEFENGKYIDINGPEGVGDKVVSLQTGSESTLRIEDIGSFHFSKEYEIGEILHQNVDGVGRGKSVLHFVDNDADEVYVTRGRNGLARFNIHTGEKTWQSPSDMITSGNTNGVTSDGEFIYTANGADGLTIFTQPQPGDSPERVFHWDLDDAQTASANMVETYDEWIFVAKGQGGVKILKRPQPGDFLPIDEYDEQGVPANLTNEIVCPSLLSHIFNDVLPNGVNNKAAHPDFFSDNIPSDIVLTEDATVAVSFIHEGAGYKNVLGYYYYDSDNPPTNIDDIIKLIAFPNASAEGSGGGLLEGNTVQLMGAFKAGTTIGFFVNSNGWNNGTITTGFGAKFTDRQFNKDNKYQSILMYDTECDATVMGFEDIHLPNSDKDFNDAIFQIITSPNNAYDITSLNQI